MSPPKNWVATMAQKGHANDAKMNLTPSILQYWSGRSNITKKQEAPAHTGASVFRLQQSLSRARP
jgi:hypothetical protein